MPAAYRVGAGVAAGLSSLLLAACGWLAPPAPPPAPAPAPGAGAGITIEQRGARWLPAAWSELPGWGAERPLEAWDALRRSCDRIAPEMRRVWSSFCGEALRTTPIDDAAARAWLEQRLQPYRVLPREASAPGEGLATGYFEPLIEASRTPRGAHRHALHAVPADLAARKPWYTRAQMETLPAAQAALRGREIAYVADPLDALVIQVQGSGRVRMT
jgi:membrane-bound lytic murein transglycosylase A